jgi:DNA-binding transcriptional MerR regulator
VTSLRRIGEVAAATGLTVRALRHYDEIGLLAPSGRSEAGYRLYADEDVRRLYRIVAFRRLGFALGEIGALLDGDSAGDLRPLIRAQLERLEAEVALRSRLRARLERLLLALDDDGPDGAGADLFLHAIEGMTMAESTTRPSSSSSSRNAARRSGRRACERPRPTGRRSSPRRMRCGRRAPRRRTRARSSSPTAGRRWSRNSRAATRGSTPR